MALDARTPILVGGGQLNNRDGGVEPIDLIVQAALSAASEAGTDRLLNRIDSIRLVRMLSWRYRDPAALVGERLGAPVVHTAYTGDGGNCPQALVSAAAADISRGRSEAVLVGGAEAWRTRMKLRAAGERPNWTAQSLDVAPAELAVADVPMVFDAHKRIGLDRPSFVYPLFEDALRSAEVRGIDDHRHLISALWSRFSEVAADNPHAWSRTPLSLDEIVTPSEANRWICGHYTKLLNSNNMVEQAAAVIVCSVGLATELGIPRDNWVFIHSGVDAHDTYDITEREKLDASAAIRLAGAAALSDAGVGVEDVEHVDLYSCFPSAVQVAAKELGLAIEDPHRPLTVTGGLTFAGGPWNNYASHAIATIATKLRENPGHRGLITANGGYLTKHSVAVYSTEPPVRPFRHRDVQDEVDRLPRVVARPDFTGVARVEACALSHDREGRPDRAFVSVRTPGGGRALVGTQQAGLLDEMLGNDLTDSPVRVADGGVLAGLG